MKLLQQIGLIAALFLASTASFAADFFDETFGNLQEELSLAKENDKKGIFIFFHMEECPFCDRMKKTILNQPDVIAFYKKHFLTYQMDIEGSNEMVDFDGTEGTSQRLSEKKISSQSNTGDDDFWFRRSASCSIHRPHPNQTRVFIIRAICVGWQLSKNVIYPL